MKKEELKLELKKNPIIKIIAKLQLLFLISIMSSPFIWIWYSGMLSLKIGLTGLIGVIICYFLDWIFNEEIKKVVDEYKPKPKSKFQERLKKKAME